MRPIVEVSMACRIDGCDGRVHLHVVRRRGPARGACDRCGATVTVDPTAVAAAERSQGHRRPLEVAS